MTELMYLRRGWTGVLAALVFCCVMISGAAVADPLPAGTPALPDNGDAAFTLMRPSDEAANLTVVPVTGEPFSQALQVQTVQAGPNAWSTQLVCPTAIAVQSGDTMLLSYYVRAIQPGDGSATVGGIFEITSDPYTKSLTFDGHVGGVWRKISLPFKSLDNYGPGLAHVTIPLGVTAQTIQIADIQLTDYGQSVPLSALPQTKSTYDGRDPNAPWRAEAAARIRKYREGNLTVVVTNADGKPVSGAIVHVVMTNHDFAFGTAVNAQHLFGTSPDDMRYQQETDKLFNQIVCENETKWPAWSDNPQTGIDMVNWGLAHGKTVRGHNLVWGSWRNSPQWLQQGYNQYVSAGGADVGKAWLEDQILKHIKDEAGQLNGKCVEFDVVNEPVDNNDFQNILGPTAIVDWYKTAHAADPDAILLLNDYNTLYGQAPDATVDGRVANITNLLAAGAPVTGIGLESHISDGAIPSVPNIIKSLDTYSKFGLEIKATEYDFTTTDSDLQADFTRDYMTLLYSYPLVKGFVVWGFWDGSHWLNNAAIFNKDWTLKKSGQVFEDLVFHQWWTDVHGTTDRQGDYTTLGFDGTYNVTVTKGNATKTVTTSLASGGDTVKVGF